MRLTRRYCKQFICWLLAMKKLQKKWLNMIGSSICSLPSTRTTYLKSSLKPIEMPESSIKTKLQQQDLEIKSIRSWLVRKSSPRLLQTSIETWPMLCSDGIKCLKVQEWLNQKRIFRDKFCFSKFWEICVLIKQERASLTNKFWFWISFSYQISKYLLNSGMSTVLLKPLLLCLWEKVKTR